MGQTDEATVNLLEGTETVLRQKHWHTDRMIYCIVSVGNLFANKCR